MHLGMSGSVRVRNLLFKLRASHVEISFLLVQFLESDGLDIHGAASDSENDGDGDDEEPSALEADDEDFDRLKETAEKEQEEAANPPPLKRRKSSTVSPRPDWPPRWWKFVLILDDGVQISFADCRRLGRIFLHQGSDPMEHTALKKLGFDALLSVPDQAQFDALVKKRSLPLKALLLNQAFAAGVGNWIADEVLYQARLHPEKRANTLDAAEMKTLRDKIIFVVKTAVELKTQSKRLPSDWLFHRRWSKVAAKKETQKTVEGHAIAFATVGGRTSAYVPALQPAPEGFVNDDEAGEGPKAKKAKKQSGSANKKKKLKKAESEDEGSLSESDNEDVDDLPVIPRSKSPRLSRQSSRASVQAESDSASSGDSEDEDSDFETPMKKKDGKRKRQSKPDDESESAPTKPPAKKRSKTEIKEETEEKEEHTPRTGKVKRKRSSVITETNDKQEERPKLAKRRSSAGKVKREPGEGH